MGLSSITLLLLNKQRLEQHIENDILPKARHMKFARRMDKIEVSGVRAMFDLAQTLKDPYDLSLGQPDFDPPDDIKEKAVQAIRKGFNKYTVTQGLPSLHDKIFKYLKEKYNYEKKNTDAAITTVGATGSLFLSCMVLIDEGDEVLIPDPYFVLYKHLVNVCLGKTVIVDTYPTQFRLTPELLERHITKKTRCIIFNNPVNPTGIAYKTDELKAFAKVFARHDIIVLADEVYSGFTFDFPHDTFLNHYENTILISAFSKTFGMPGWRLGYAVGHKEIIEKMITLQQFSYVCAPAPLQMAVMEAFEGDTEQQIQHAYKKKRDLVCDILNRQFEFARTQGAFYVFPKVPWGNDKSFVQGAFKKNIVLVPGSTASSRDTHFRISFAMSDDRLEQALKALCELAKAGE